MKYRIVLQWPVFSTSEFDRLIEIEDLLIDELGDESEVDGHDIGAEEMNIFIDTENVDRTFAQIKNTLEGCTHWTDLRVAYRKIDDDQYTILWPKGLSKFGVS